MGSFRKIIVALLAPALARASTTVHTCAADNCLRQVRSNSLKASPYCTSYISDAHPRITPSVTVTSYVSVTATVFKVIGASSTDIVSRKDVPYTPLDYNKRGLAEVPDPTPAPALEARQAGLPTFASFCTGDVNRLSSACSCLVGYSLTVPTTTLAKTIPGAVTTISVCNPGNYDYQYSLRDGFSGGYETRHNQGVIGGQRISSIKDIQGCCNKCFHTSECTAYHLDPETSECELDLLTSSLSPTPNDPLCPAGLQEIYDPYNGLANNTYGIGLCGYLVPSDE